MAHTEREEQIYPISGTIETRTVTFGKGRRTQTAEVITAQAWTEIDEQLKPMTFLQVARKTTDGMQELLAVSARVDRYLAPVMGITDDGRETVDTRATGIWVREDRLR